MVEKQVVEGKRKKLKKFHILIIILALFIFAGIYSHNQSNKRKSQFRLKVDEYRAAGYPVTMEELDQMYSISPGKENAAGFIQDAVTSYKEPNDAMVLKYKEWAIISSLVESSRGDIIKHAVTYLDDNRKSLALLHKAAMLDYCRYPIKLSADQKPNYLDIQKMVKLLCVEAIIHAENGESQACVESLVSGLKIADSLYDVPLYISQYARLIYQEMNIDAIERSINITDFTNQQMAQLNNTISDTLRPSGISYGLRGQLCRLIRDFESVTTSNIPADEDEPLTERLFFSAYRMFGFVESDYIMYLDFTYKYLEAGELPLHERLDAAKKIRVEISKIPSTHVILKKTAPNLTDFLLEELNSISKFRVAQAALAVQRYKLKNGKLPDSLKNLVTEYFESVPLDPFDGKEIRYKITGPGFVIYTVGPNKKDEVSNIKFTIEK